MIKKTDFTELVPKKSLSKQTTNSNNKPPGGEGEKLTKDAMLYCLKCPVFKKKL